MRTPVTFQSYFNYIETKQDLCSSFWRIKNILNFLIVIYISRIVIEQAQIVRYRVVSMNGVGLFMIAYAQIARNRLDFAPGN